MQDFEHEIHNLTKQLTQLRLQRQDFYLQADAQEQRIVTRIRQLGNPQRDIVPHPSAFHNRTQAPAVRRSNRTREDNRSIATPPDLPDLVSSEEPSSVRPATRTTTFSFSTVHSPRNLDVGDRVKILNKTRFVKGRPTEKDRLATVVRKTQFYIHLLTDSGYTTSRVVKNLLKIGGENERALIDPSPQTGANGANGFLDF